MNFNSKITYPGNNNPHNTKNDQVYPASYGLKFMCSWFLLFIGPTFAIVGCFWTFDSRDAPENGYRIRKLAGNLLIYPN